MAASEINIFHFNPATEKQKCLVILCITFTVNFDWILVNNLGSLLMALNTLKILTWYLWKVEIKSSINQFVTVGL